MAQTTIQGSFLGDATVTGAKIGADFISAQTALTTGLATTDEIIVSDAGVIKRMDISVFEIAATQITASGTLPALNGAALTALTAANITASGTLPALNGAALTALTAANITASGTLPALNGAALTALTADNIGSGTVPVARLGDGNESNSTFLRGDNTWVAVTGTTINTNADNRVITGSGTANTLNGESSLTYDGTTLALSAATTKVFTVETTATDTVAEMRLEVAASSTSENYIQFRQGDGSGSANNMAYRIGYNAGDGYFRFRSGDTDGSSADADIWRVNDGTKELLVADGATAFPSVPKGLAKAWAAYDNDGTFTTLLLYNCAATDTAVGRCAIAFGTDFSGTTWSAAGSSDENASFRKQAIAAGTMDAQFRTTAAQALVDSNFCSVVFFGDQ